jgi:hypothetical protein
MATVPEKTEPPLIFISYSHRDAEYLSRLMIHLKPLARQGRIDAWADTRIQAGDKWQDEIKAALEKSAVGVLLISADFLASDFIVNNELEPLLDAASTKGTLILSLILKPSRFLREDSLNKFQAINDAGKPLALLPENERETFYDRLAERIEQKLPKQKT